MNERVLTLKDFVLSKDCDIKMVSHKFQQYIDQQNRYQSKSYWVDSKTGIGSHIEIYNSTGNYMDAYVANDYLGMSQNEKTKEAGIEAVRKYGTGACAAQAIGGYLDIHRHLENEISEFVGHQDAILFSSGFGANAGLLRAILGKNDIAYVDSFIHTSAMSGLIGTNVKNVGHNNTEYLDAVLSRQHGYNTRAVIIDGVYSQDGDLCNLPEYVRICRKHGCLLIMDDAHGIGVMGENGRGTAEHFDMLGQVDVITGTFSKSFGCVGGFVASSKELIQYLRYYADSNVFSAAITPQATASITKALELIKSTPSIREKLWNNVNYLRAKLTEEGFDIGHSESAIFPIMVRDNEKVYRIADELQKRSIFVSGITYPAVRTKEARLRVSILSTHEKSQLDHLVQSLVDIRKDIPF